MKRFDERRRVAGLGASITLALHAGAAAVSLAYEPERTLVHYAGKRLVTVERSTHGVLIWTHTHIATRLANPRGES